MYCFENYVIADLNKNSVIDTSAAHSMLNDVNNFYGNSKVVFVSNRQFSNDVDPEVYKLVDHKKLVGIAIVGSGQQQRVQAANEQALYSGSFGFFENLESAISWAQSFIKSKATG